MQQHGILVVHKPIGLSSHDVVQKLRRAYGMTKVGHTGTLDPLAEGVLVITFGKATKLVQFLASESKAYHVGIKLGCQTDTQDITGRLVAKAAISKKASQALRENIPQVLASFVGTYEQVPPMYAAIKVHGKKLYEYARRNQSVKRTPRALRVFSLDYDSASYHFDEKLAMSRFTFRVHASKGLYARTLCVDIGEKLGVPATMESLLRVAVGTYTLAQAHQLADVLAKPQALIPLKAIALPYRCAYVEMDVANKLRQGYKLPHDFVDAVFAADEVFAVYDNIDKELIGLYRQSEKYPDKYQSIRII